MSYKEEAIIEVLRENGFFYDKFLAEHKPSARSLMRGINEIITNQSQSNLLDQKIDKEGCEIEKPDIKDDEFGDYYSRLKRWEDAPTLRQEREELKRLKEENDKLVNSVGEWSALAIDRKQDLDEANKKIEELKEGIDEILDLYHGDGVINQTWILIHLKELKKLLTK